VVDSVKLAAHFNRIEVNIKRLNPNAVLPSYSKAGDAGMDLTSISRTFDKENQFFEYGTGISIEIPEGHVGLLYPRSSLSNKDLVLCNSVGVIDSGYRGEIKFRFKLTLPEDANPNIYFAGDRVGQLVIMPYPKIRLLEVDELSDSSRGTKGFGSTNTKES